MAERARGDGDRESLQDEQYILAIARRDPYSNFAEYSALFFAECSESQIILLLYVHLQISHKNEGPYVHVRLY